MTQSKRTESGHWGWWGWGKARFLRLKFLLSSVAAILDWPVHVLIGIWTLPAPSPSSTPPHTPLVLFVYPRVAGFRNIRIFKWLSCPWPHPPSPPCWIQCCKNRPQPNQRPARPSSSTGQPSLLVSSWPPAAQCPNALLGNSSSALLAWTASIRCFDEWWALSCVDFKNLMKSKMARC